MSARLVGRVCAVKALDACLAQLALDAGLAQLALDAGLAQRGSGARQTGAADLTGL